MSIVKILSEHLVNQIAAGEVVERPSSCVKELVENSIDAGANIITVEVSDGGRTLIRVSDNGIGMRREDAVMALKRHATSKISDEKDLWDIRTMGFRGEALPSIASVSQFVLKTKERDSGAVAGTEIVCDGGDVKTVQDCGMQDGTIIEVHNLFFNTPARSKYLKQDATEIAHIISLLHSIALANTWISFTFINNGKVSFKLPSTESLERRISDIFGTATKDAMLPVFYGGSDFKLSGFIGKPAISRTGGKHQYIFVNRRPIQHHLITHKIKEAFHSLLMEGKNPVFILNIEIDPTLIDVNVHPRKIEIRFEDQSRILAVIYMAVKTSLEKHNLMPRGFTESRSYKSDAFPKFVGSGDFARNEVPMDSLKFTKDFSAPKLDLERDNSPRLRAITQVSNAYIVAENDSGLVLIDQHAAHERVRYFELLDQFYNSQKNIQPLLLTEVLDLTLDDLEILKTNLQIFRDLGFEIEEGPGQTLTLYSVPLVLSSEDIKEVLHGVLDDLSNSSVPTNKQGRIETILHYMACRSAIKFGKKLSIDEMDILLQKLEKLDRPYTCPHGRPTMISLTFDELEKMFGRK